MVFLRACSDDASITCIGLSAITVTELRIMFSSHRTAVLACFFQAASSSTWRLTCVLEGKNELSISCLFHMNTVLGIRS